MKKCVIIIVFTIAFLGIVNSVWANNYYFSSSGNDSRSVREAQRPTTPWRSVEKLNSIMPVLAPGDSVFFKRGDVFYGQIIISASGTPSQPIVFSAYGTGRQPVVTALTTISRWQNIGKGISEAICASCKERPNVVLINNELQPMGRYPNVGYLVYHDFLGKSSLLTNQLTHSTDWRGAEIVMKKKHWQIDRKRITGVAGDTISFATASQYEGTKGFGFFIQDALATLDTVGEWYYNTAANRLSVFFGTSHPSAMMVRVSTIDTLVFIKNAAHIVLDNLVIEGANKFGVLLNEANHVTIQNCSVENTGYNAIHSRQSDFVRIIHSSLNYTLNNGIALRQSDHAIINGNTIKNTGFIPGMGDSGNGSYVGISAGSNATITNNRIDSTGYIPIMFGGHSCVIANNFIDTYCFNVDDGGGIYTFGGRSLVRFQQRVVKDNIVINGIGAPDGANGILEVHAIYMDEGASQVTISGNTIANCASAGLLLHHANDIVLDSNVIINDKGVLYLSEDRNSPPITNIKSTHNLLITTSPSQACLTIKKMQTDPDKMGDFDHNHYWKIIDTSTIVDFHDYNDPEAAKPLNWWKGYSLSGWKSAFSQDIHSNGAPVIFRNLDQIFFRYNPTSTDQTITLEGLYMNPEGSVISGSIILKPFKSVVLIRA